MTTAALMDRKLLDDKELLARRKGWVAEIEKLEAEHLEALPEFNAAVDAAADRVKKAKEALAEAEAAYRVTLGPRSEVALRVGRQRSLLQGRLRDSSPAEIDEFLTEIKAEDVRLQRGDPKTVTARQARAADLRASRIAAEELRLQALTPAELAERLDEIREGGADEVTT